MDYQSPLITVWIHGTLPQYIFPPLGYITIESFTNFFYCKPGLHKASSYAKKYHHYAIAKTLAESDPKQFPFEHFYLFGWSGKLGNEERLKAAEELSKALSVLLKKYVKKNGKPPIIKIITHSHGGNVALNLVNTLDKNIEIADLILLAIPVQHETEEYASNRIFKKVYSLHSHWDLLQVADPQGWPSWWESIKQAFQVRTQKQLNSMFKTMEQHDLFSNRHFAAKKKISQANIEYNGRGLLHIEFLLLPFVKQLPYVLFLLNSPKKRAKLVRQAGDYLISLKATS